MYQSTATAINFAGRKGDDMTKGWRNNIALVERRDRLARERAERRVAVIKAETAAMMDDGGRFFLYGDGQVMYAPPPEDWRSHYPDLYGVTT